MTIDPLLLTVIVCLTTWIVCWCFISVIIDPDYCMENIRKISKKVSNRTINPQLIPATLVSEHSTETEITSIDLEHLSNFINNPEKNHE